MQLELERTESAPGATPEAIGAEAPDSADTSAWSNLSLLRNIKLGLFHIGSSMADILAIGVWNRIMIKELGFAATPIALLLALRYFLAPLSIWVGHRSDTRPWRGYRRLPYVWGGRLITVVSYFLLGISTLELAGSYDGTIAELTVGLANITVTQNAGSLLGWAGVAVSLVMFSVGSTFSSTTFLSLIHDRAPKHQRSRAVGVVWFFLILGFAVAGLLFSRLLPEYTRDGFLSLFLVAPLIMGSLWFFAVLGEEKPIPRSKMAAPPPANAFGRDLKAVWASRQTRLFFLFLALSFLFFYMQDVILEPFAAEVFGMSVATTSRFSMYWGSLTLIGIIASLILSRRYPKTVTNTALARWGVMVLIVAFGIFFVCAVAEIRALVTVGLVVMGLGLGMWTVGPLGMMMDMTRAWGAGLYLSLWTVSSTLARGAGVVAGGVILDLALALTGGQQALAYASVFLIQVVGFAGTWAVLRQINLRQFDQEAPRAEPVFASAME
jgi:BCD family chlorophyll transporter-like MFS transporter